jgi:DNA-binding IclR family transcriptional regulator
VGTKAKPSNGHKKTDLNYKTAVPAVEQASRILFYLASSPQFKMRLTDICDQVGIAKSKGHSILSTLKQFELVEQDMQAKTYSLGPALIFLSHHVLDNLDYPNIAAPFLEDLVEETNGTAAFGLISGSHVLVVAMRNGNQNIGFRVPVGHRFHITLGAHGKAIAAFMDETEREKLLAKKEHYFYGEDSRINMRRLKSELAECRAAGFAQDIGEVTPGVNVVSAPVFSTRQKIAGSIILIGTFAASDIPEYGPKVVEAAKQISHKLGAQIESVYPM